MLERIRSSKKLISKTVIPAVIVVSLLSLRAAVKMNFFNYNNHSEKYLYVHSDTYVYTLVENLRKVSGEGKIPYDRIRILIILRSTDYWPLPWMLSDWNYIVYRDTVDSMVLYDDDLVIVPDNEIAAFEKNIKVPYIRVRRRFKGDFPLVGFYYKEEIFRGIIKENHIIVWPQRKYNGYKSYLADQD